MDPAGDDTTADLSAASQREARVRHRHLSDHGNVRLKIRRLSLSCCIMVENQQPEKDVSVRSRCAYRLQSGVTIYLLRNGVNNTIYCEKNCDGDLLSFFCVIVVSDSTEHQVTNISFAQCMQPLHSPLVVVGFNATQK